MKSNNVEGDNVSKKAYTSLASSNLFGSWPNWRRIIIVYTTGQLSFINMFS